MTRTLDNRWIRRYRLFFIIGSIILSIQVFLAYKFFSIDTSDSDNNINGLEHFDPSRREKVLFENEDANGAVSSRRVKDDDEDSPSNSNALYNKHKVPPDKSNVISATIHEVGKSVPNRTSLRLDELDFVPSCNVYTKEAISAIHRAKTQRCKQHLVNITCLIQSGKLYPTRLTNSCPAPGFTAGKSLGCFKDEKTFRVLSGYYANLKTTNSPQQCINMCLQSGFPYAGVEYSTECFCGHEEPPLLSRVSDSSCNMKCPADPAQACGGYLALSAFHTGIAKFSPQMAREKPDSPTEPAARVVFLLTLNGRAVRQVRRLIKLLYHEQHYFFIHVDARQDYMFRELLPLERALPNVRLARRRWATIWGGASLLHMLLASMREILQLGWQWDFIVNLSESDLPVKTNDALVAFLAANKGRNFVKCHGREVQRFIQKQGLDKTFVECDQHMWRVGSRVLPWGVTMDGGSDWMALARPFVQYVSAQQAAAGLVQSLMVIFEHTLLPAESFFHTVLRNTAFCSSYVDNNLHVTNWKRKLGCKCQYKHVVDWCGCSPNDFKPDDWPRLQGTSGRQLYFARKFEPIVSQDVIQRLDEWLYGPYPADVASLSRYWQSVYHHADLSPLGDQAVTSVAASLAMAVARGLHTQVTTVTLLEVTSYFLQDVYEGALVKFQLSPDENDLPVTVETWIQYKPDVTIHEPGQASIKGVVVSSEFDVKEQVCHNLLGALGPYSGPVLVVATLPADAPPYNATVLWLDPSGQLQDVQEIHVDTASGLLSSVKAAGLGEPLQPGVWEVKVVHNGAPMASARFLVTPLYLPGQSEQLKHTPTWLLHKNNVPNHDGQSEWQKFLPSQSEREALLRGAELNAKRVGEDLGAWLDSLTKRFYRTRASCVASDASLPGLEPCAAAAWSSFTPDPKSHVGQVNATSGRLLRW